LAGQKRPRHGGAADHRLPSLQNTNARCRLIGPASDPKKLSLVAEPISFGSSR